MQLAHVMISIFISAQFITAIKVAEKNILTNNLNRNHGASRIDGTQNVSFLSSCIKMFSI